MAMTAMPSSSRILFDVPCVVCSDHSSGKHYGVYACDGCAGFFKRSVRRQRQYICKARAPGCCLVDKAHRNQCRSCRLDKCLDAGMNRDAVQHERGPRSSTLRRQMALFMTERVERNQPTFSVQAVPEMESKDLLPLPPPPLNLLNPYAFNRQGLVSPPVAPYLSGLPPIPFSGLMVSLNRESLCENAAKLIFINVRWTKGINIFESLPIGDRLHLITHSWKDLFILGSAELMYPMDLKMLINPNNTSIDVREVEILKAVIFYIFSLKPHTMEFNLLRLIMLFNTSSCDQVGDESRSHNETEGRLQEFNKINEEYLKHMNKLSKFACEHYPQAALRTGQLLRILSLVSQISSALIVELFFRPTIGHIPLNSILCDIYKTA